MKVRLKRAALEAALARRNWTKSALARLAGLHRTHLSDLLAGRTSPGPRTRKRLLEALGGGFDDYFEVVGGHDDVSEEERILQLLEYLTGRHGHEVEAGRKRLLEMLETLRGRGWLNASDRTWLAGEWHAFRAVRQDPPGRRGSVGDDP
jgi:transcriptional regulator with XRE-family HTH domain